MTRHIDIAAELAAHTTEVGECLEWTGTYGSGRRNLSTPILRRRIDGKRVELLLTREVYKLHHGEIPAGLTVYRTCCNYACLAKAHLAVGPMGSHMRQRQKLGLARHSQSTRAAIALAQRSRSKYRPEQIAEVRALLCEGLTVAETSRRTGVHRDTVSDVKGRRAWLDTAPAGSVWSWGGVA